MSAICLTVRTLDISRIEVIQADPVKYFKRGLEYIGTENNCLGINAGFIYVFEMLQDANRPPTAPQYGVLVRSTETLSQLDKHVLHNQQCCLIMSWNG